MMRGSSSLSVFKYSLQAHNKDAHRELRGGESYVFNSVVNTKLPAILSHRRSTTASLETYPIYSFVTCLVFKPLTNVNYFGYHVE